MKKISILLMLMALFGPLAMMGQNRATLTVYDQNTTTNEYVPIYGYWADSKSKCEFIIPKEAISAMSGGGVISAMKFYLGNSDSNNDISTTFTVFVKEVTTTTLTGFTGQDGTTTVYNSTISIPKNSSNLEINIPFSTNYTYNGENLLVGFYQTGNSSYNHTYWTGVTQTTNTAWAGYGSQTGSAQKFLPKTTFTYTPGTTPYISLAPSSATVYTGFTETLTASYGNVTGTPTISYSTSNASVATVSGNGTTATVTAVSAGTATITATMNGSYTATCAITVEDPSYCTPYYSNTSDYIKSFVTTGGTTNINNTNTGQGTGGYSDFYNSHFASISDGETLSFTVTRGYNDSYKYAIWVDWNHDYVFDVNTETVASQTTSVKQDWSSSFTIPAGTAAGDYHMRVEMLYGSSNTLNPCVSASYGEVEDYKLTVLATSNCPTPTPGNVTDLMPTSATLNWTGESDDYYVRYRTAAFTRTIFEDDFESGLSNWTIYSEGETLDGFDGWFAYDASQFAGGATEGNHNGDVSAVSCSWASNALDADNWLVTPQVELNGTLTFWVYSYYGDKYEVKLSTTGNSISNFTTTLQSLTAAASTWTEVSIPLSSYAGQPGYIAIHHDFTDGQWLLIDDFGIYVSEAAGQWIPNATGANTSDNSHDITGLTPEMDYEWQVMADCGTDGASGWSAMATFTTPSACATPFDPNTTNISATSAKLNWTGYQAEYNVSYAKVLFYENFENGLGDWTTKREGAGTANTDWRVVNSETAFTNGPIPAHSGTMVAMSRSYSGSAYSVDNWLITPQVTLDGVLKFWVFDDGVYHEHYDVYVSTTTTDVSAFSLFYAPGDATSTWTEVTVDLSSYQGVQGYIALRHVDNDQDFLFIDDFGIYKDLQSATSTTNNVTIEGLTPMTDYMWQVQGDDCDGNGGTTDWSEYVFFTTTNQYVKHIVGYSNYENNKGGWYLIASPIGTVLPTAVINMIPTVNGELNVNSADYDLFTFDQNETDEWRNYKQGRFTKLEPGKGYLYANKENVDLIFTIGAGTAYDGNGVVNLVYSESNTIDPFMRGWNLVGNPYGQTAWINNRPYYTLNDVGDEYVPINADDASIEPMEGIFVVATGTGQSVTFSTTPPSNRGSSLTINVNEDGKFVDRAIVDFNQNGTLPKFQFDRNHTKVYIPQDGQDYAIVCSKAIGALPVNFKAENNGTYSLSFSSKNAEFAYLHLVDNMTGADIDLLQTPSYSFEAKTTDYESRFKLVFATGDNSKEENFAFFSNGSFVINNEGEATLQVIDIMGRIIKSESINRCTNVNVNAAPGVYMLRLVNGDSVKVQKVVVK